MTRRTPSRPKPLRWIVLGWFGLESEAMKAARTAARRSAGARKGWQTRRASATKARQNGGAGGVTTPVGTTPAELYIKRIEASGGENNS